MDVNLIIIATVLVTVVGAFVGVFLGISAIKFEVPVDSRETEVREALPGANCGACGYPGCGGLAHAIATGEAPVNACPVGGESCAVRVGEIMGVSADFEKEVAFNRCGGTCSNTRNRYVYMGIEDCNAATMVPGGSHKECTYGCLGLGSCQAACEYEAIDMVQGIAKIIPDNCVACKACVAACPKDLIAMVPYSATQVVRCMNTEKAKAVKSACDVGCIACKRCEKACQDDAIHVVNNLASIQYEKCIRCGKCAEVCPQDTITWTMLDPELFAPKEELQEVG